MSPIDKRFTDAFNSAEKIQGLTHNFYRYPARFSPKFVRFILDEMTKPGDWVLDPFMGGGTTIVEAIASGRQAVGTDVNALSHFVTKAKTTPLSDRDRTEVRDWVYCVWKEMAGASHLVRPAQPLIRNLPTEVQPFFTAARRLARQLRFARCRRFAYCALLGVGQLVLDCKTYIPDTTEMCNRLKGHVESMFEGLDRLVNASREAGTRKNKITSLRHVMNLSSADHRLVRSVRVRDAHPKLILTSPPYPGVHVVYHRWQILGRRETPAPYWIAHLRDGHGEAYYTMGGRSAKGVSNYFESISRVFTTIRQVVSLDTQVVQLVAFSDANSQLPLYLDAMAKAGFQETYPDLVGSGQVRLVPNRKWYNQRRQSSDASREHLLVHRPATDPG